jgi:catechol 2,3-dioxygenase-like lactoylglutathione lyase family enzyme
MELRGIHHVNIAVADIEAARTFYCDVMGCTEVPRPDFGFPGLWLDAGGEQIHFMQSNDAPRNGDHFAFEVADLDAAVADLESKGVKVNKLEPAVPGAGKQAFLNDPWGNLLELNQPD